MVPLPQYPASGEQTIMYNTASACLLCGTCRPADSVVSSQDCAGNNLRVLRVSCGSRQAKSILASSCPATFTTANALTFLCPGEANCTHMLFSARGHPISLPAGHKLGPRLQVNASPKCSPPRECRCSSHGPYRGCKGPLANTARGTASVDLKRRASTIARYPCAVFCCLACFACSSWG